MGYVYILRCCDGTLYVGSTRDLSRRLSQHQEGMGSAYTKRRLPVELIWSEEFARIDEAFAWEKRLQGWSHAKRLAFIDGGLDAVREWSVGERRARAARARGSVSGWPVSSRVAPPAPLNERSLSERHPPSQ